MGRLTPNASDGLPNKVTTAFRHGSQALTEAMLFIGGDLLVGLGCFGVAALMTHAEIFAANFIPTMTWLGGWVIWRFYQGFYPGYGKSPQTELRLHTIGTVSIALLQLAAAFTFHRLGARAMEILVEWGLILVLGLVVRYNIRRLLIKNGTFGRRVSVIGAGASAALLINYLLSHPEYGLRPVAAYDDNSQLHMTSLGGVPIKGDIELALREPQTQQALIAIPGARAEIQQRLINSVYATFPITWVIPDLFGVPNQAMQPHNIGSIASLEIKNNLHSRQSQIIKRFLDFLLAILALIMIFPIMIIVAIAIRIDSNGSIIYSAQRIGRNGELFPCLKFRSMYEDAEERLIDLLNSDTKIAEEYGTFHKIRNDPRITPVGRFIRKASLDELPQLVNVLLGQMSIVGPRPYLPREKGKMGEVLDQILLVRPGITGYWQVNERSESTFERRLEMDRFYISNWSPWLDAVVIIQTVRVVLIGKGAH